MNNKYLLEITNLCKNYTNENNSKIEIIKNLNFKLKQNTKVSIVGPSGSGKTTFLNIIGLLDSEYDGNFYFKNKDISLCSKDETNKIRGLSIGFIHQFFHLIPELTVIENVMLPLLINKNEKKSYEISKKLLLEFGLDERINYKPLKLSGGEQQRVAIARSLVNNPDLILADEMTGNLDEDTANNIFKFFINYIEQNKKTLVYVTHNKTYSLLADEIYYFKNKKIHLKMNNPFIHLRSLSSYSLSESTLKITNLVDLAKKNDMPAIAITDNNNMFGVFEFSKECVKNNIQPIIGTSINLLDIIVNNQISQVTFLVKNEIGYRNLLELSSLSHLNEGNNVGIYFSQLEKFSEGLFCYIGGEFNPLLLLNKENKKKDIIQLIDNFKKVFKQNFLFEIQRINDQNIDVFEKEFINLSKEFDIPLIGSNNIKYANKDDYSAHDALLCIAQKSTINNSQRNTSNENIYFKSNEEMYSNFEDIPEIIQNNLNISLSCNYFPESTKPQLPEFKNDLNLSAEDFLLKTSELGLEKKIKEKNIKNIEIYTDRLKYENEIIIRMGFAGYFLIVADFVNWAKEQSIPVGPGRGSGAGSLVAWCLGITDLDPLEYELLFERFLNPERVSMPDFDIDFCQTRRDEVIEYVNNKYGSECVAHIITFGTLASRAAVRDIGRVLEVPYGEVDSFAKLIPFNPSNPLTLSESIKSERSLQERISSDERISNIIDVSLKIEGTHRHASTHAAGVVIGHEKLSKVVPLYKDQNTNTNATQFSMKYVEEAGLIKFDFLGLTTLSIIDDCIKLIIKENKNFLINNIPLMIKKHMIS